MSRTRGGQKHGRTSQLKPPSPKVVIHLYEHLRRRKKKTLVKGSGRGKEGVGGRGWLQVRAKACNKDYGGPMSYKTPRLQLGGTWQIYCFPASATRLQGRLRSNLGDEEGVFLHIPPPPTHSPSPPYWLFGRKQVELKRRLTLRAHVLYSGVFVCGGVIFSQRKNEGRRRSEWLKPSVCILFGNYYKYVCGTLSSAEYSEGFWNGSLSRSVGKSTSPSLLFSLPEKLLGCDCIFAAVSDTLYMPPYAAALDILIE